MNKIEKEEKFINIELNLLFRIRDMPIIVPSKSVEDNMGSKDSSKLLADKWMFKDKRLNSNNIKINDVLRYCYGNGKYCALNDAYWLYNPIESLDQSIYQMCLLDEAKKQNKVTAFLKFFEHSFKEVLVIWIVVFMFSILLQSYLHI